MLRLFSRPTDTQIIAAIDSWILAMAVGSANGSYTCPDCGFLGSKSFDDWLAISRKNWMPAIQHIWNIPEARIESALRKFVSVNFQEHWQTIHDRELILRGRDPAEQVVVTEE